MFRKPSMRNPTTQNVKRIRKMKIPSPELRNWCRDSRGQLYKSIVNYEIGNSECFDAWEIQAVLPIPISIRVLFWRSQAIPGAFKTSKKQRKKTKPIQRHGCDQSEFSIQYMWPVLGINKSWDMLSSIVRSSFSLMYVSGLDRSSAILLSVARSIPISPKLSPPQLGPNLAPMRP